MSIGRIWIWLFKLSLGVMAALGASALAVVLFMWWLLSGPSGEAANAERVRDDVRAEVSQVESVQSANDCACASGGVCRGPRGGIYCLDASGKKNYKSRQ